MNKKAISSPLLVIVLLAVFGLGASAPTWPAGDLAYFQAAGAQIQNLYNFAGSGMTAFSKGDTNGLQTAIDDVQAVATYFTQEQAPARLAPVSNAGKYAGDTCLWVLNYFTNLKADAATSAFVVPTLISMRMNCLDSIQAARMELARAVAAVGAWPPAK